MNPPVHRAILALAVALPLSAAQTAFAQHSAQTAAPTVVSPATVTPTAGSAAAAIAPLSLDESIRIALRQNGSPQAAAQSFEAARQGVTSARSDLFPEVSASLGYNYRNGSGRSTTTTTIDPTTGGTIVSGGGTRIITSSSTTTGISISQNIFDSGRTRQRINQANARALGAAGSYGSSRNSLAFNVAAAFFDQLRQGKLVAQREGQVALAAQQLEAITAQIEAGTVARVDAQTVQVTLSQARFDLTTARNNLNTAQTNFRNVLGLGLGPALPLQESPLAVETGLPDPTPEVESNSTVPPAVTELPPVAAGPTELQPNEVAPAAPAPAPAAAEDVLTAPLPNVPQLRPMAEYLAEAQRLRPDLLQSRATLQSGEAAIKLAQIEQRPQITASANYNIDPRSTSDRGFNFGAGVSIPIFDAGGRKADVRAAQAEQEANRARLGQLEKDVAADVETAYVGISGEVQRIANARVLVQQARVNLDNATEKYRLGLGTVLDITNAQTQLFNAQTSLTSAVYDYELARADLDRAVGRFAWADPGQVPAAAPSSVATAATTVKATSPVPVAGK